MADKTIADMTLSQLKLIIQNEIAFFLMAQNQQRDVDQAKQALEWLKANRWAPPAGTPSTTDMIREDRDQ